MTRWEVTKAVRASDLPSPSRLIMLTLADAAEVGTAEIPPQFTPSIRVLAGETGLDKSTVKRHLAALEEAGWVVRSRPDAKAMWQGERTRYRLDLPRGAEPPVVGAEEDLGADVPQGGRTEPPGVGAREDQPGRTESHLETDHSDHSQTKVRSRSKALAIVDRPDVERLCIHLADRIEGNGSKRPNVTQAWRDAARRLLDRDNRTEEQVMRAIDWCQDDEFWRANILSMPKLRERYDALRLQAQRQAATKKSTTDQRFADAQALKAKFKGKVS